jgi:GAF domain-containing protein
MLYLSFAISFATGIISPFSVSAVSTSPQQMIWRKATPTLGLRAGFRALLVTPLVRGEEIVGMLVVRRRTPGVFRQAGP